MNVKRRSFLQSSVALLGFGILLGSLAAPTAAAENLAAPAGNIWDIFRTRRSVRKFKPDAIPDHYTRVCITPLGIPVEWPDSPPKKGLDEFIAYETLGN
jgi:hypothetical protein